MPKTPLIFALFLASVALLPVTHASDELKIKTVRKGDCDQVAANGNTVIVHYAGTLQDGSEFDSSYKRGEPFDFVLGQGSVIKGWEEGVKGMCKGEIRELVIPPHKAYGKHGSGAIPPQATLNFKVELLDLKDGEQYDRDL